VLPVDAFDRLRSDLDDAVAPYLWSDDELFDNLSDAQKMFCRLTDGIADSSTPAITKINFGVGADWLNLSPLILKIRSAYLVSTGAPIEIINAEDMARLCLRFDGSTGPLLRLVEGMEENRLRAMPIASVADAVQMSVFRLPKLDVCADTNSAFEIGEQHHLHLLLWAKHLAYGKNDAQTRNEAASKAFGEKFETYCFSAREEQRKKRHKVRTVTYGGI
jgi:hypothetical protein